MASKPKNDLPLPAGRVRRSPDDRVKTCKHCGANFMTKCSRSMYCTTKCEMAYRRAHRPLPIDQVEKARERALSWYSANKDKALERIKEATANRRAAMKARPGKITRTRVRELLSLQQGKCAVCHSLLDKYHIDHIMPLALGGDNTNENLQLLCPACNLSKSAKHPVEFMQMKGYLL